MGDAAPKGWDFNDMEQFTKNGGTYSWSGHLMPSPAVFRFQVKDVGLFPSIVVDPSDESDIKVIITKK